jgi:acetyl esterase/lipase
MSLAVTLLFIVFVLVIVLWLLGIWFAHGEDLTAWDHSVEPSASESFSRPGGPSEEHQAVVREFEALAPEVEGKSRKELLQFTRDFMEDFPRGKTFDCEFRPVDVGGVPAEWVIAPGAEPNRRVLYLHGGAFIAGSPNSHRTVTSRFSELARAAVLAVDYRLMPENPRITSIEDCRTAYRWILENGPEGAAPVETLFMGGDSAGGNLSLVMSAWARDEKLRAADAVVALSPLTDSSYSGPSIAGNLETDAMLGPMFGGLLKIPKPILSWIFVLENRMRPVNPLVSPLMSGLQGLPPTLVQVSASEMLLDDARRYVNKARAAGSPVRLQTWEGVLHVWQIFQPEVPEACEAFEQIDKFLRSCEG